MSNAGARGIQSFHQDLDFRISVKKAQSVKKNQAGYRIGNPGLAQRRCAMGRGVPLPFSATLNLGRFNGGGERDIGSGYPVSSYLATRGRSLKHEGGIR